VFAIGKYSDEILRDVVPMHASHFGASMTV